MAKLRQHNCTLCRIREVYEVTKQHYEEGNQSKCYKAVWRSHIYPKFGIGYMTYLKYINATSHNLSNQIK